MAHGTNRPFLHIIIIHIIHIIFLFQPASAKFDSKFPTKAYGRVLFTLLASSSMFKKLCFIASCQLQPLVSSFQSILMTTKPYKCTPNNPLKSNYCIINYQNLLNIFAGIPIACKKLKLLFFRIEKSYLHM